MDWQGAEAPYAPISLIAPYYGAISGHTPLPPLRGLSRRPRNAPRKLAPYRADHGRNRHTQFDAIYLQFKIDPTNRCGYKQTRSWHVSNVVLRKKVDPLNVRDVVMSRFENPVKEDETPFFIFQRVVFDYDSGLEALSFLTTASRFTHVCLMNEGVRHV